MLIAMTGLHGAGKSYFASNIPAKYGFKVYNKKEIIKFLCKKKRGETIGDNGIKKNLIKMLIV